MREIKKILVLIIIIIGITFVSLIINASNKTHKKTKEINDIGITYDYVKKIGNMKNEVSVGGVIKENNIVAVFGENGRIEKIFFSEGDYVREGDTIAKFSDDEKKYIEIELEKLKLKEKNILNEIRDLTNSKDEKYYEKNNYEIEIKNLELSYEYKKRQIIEKDKELNEIEAKFEKENQFYERGIIAYNELKPTIEKRISLKREIESIKNDSEKIKLEKLKIENKIEEIEEKIKKEIEEKNSELKMYELEMKEKELKKMKVLTQIISPVSGIVKNISVKNGELIINKEICQISEVKARRIIAEIPEYYADGIKIGQKVNIDFSQENNKKYYGKIKKINKIIKEMKENDKMVEAELEIRNLPEDIKIGTSINIEMIIKEKKNVTAIPVLAMRKEKEKYYIFVLNKKNIVEKRIIKTGIQSGIFIEIEGAKIGEKIIVSSNEEIKEGIKIRKEGV